MILTWALGLLLVAGAGVFLWIVLTPAIEEIERHHGPNPECACHKRRP